MEKHVLIVENGTDSLKKNESAQAQSKFLLSGIFTEFDIENRNRRFYKAENFIPCMEALLAKRKMLTVLYGEFDHPDVFDIAGKNASHAIESLVHNESGNRVDGSIALLSTHWGKEARAIINDGYPLFVSSRAAGITDGSGNVALKELFTYDIVLDPGFASARVSVNESLGYKTNDVNYRIYEMKDDQVQNLFVDNKNDGKTAKDLKYMEIVLADELIKLEHQILTKLGSKVAPEEVKALMEKYDLVNSEMSQVKEYLEFLKVKVSTLVKENSKLEADNKKLFYELNENTAYSNHIASQLKNLNKYTTDIETRLSVDEKMIEYVAEHAKANILFTEDIASNITKLNETVINNADFLEYVANETKVAQLFAESVASEVKDTQGFLEYVATESEKEEIFLNYVAEKVDGIIGYSVKTIDKIKTSIPVNENASTEDSIHSIESITDFLGIQEEQEVANNIVTSTEPVVETTVPTETTPVAEVTTEVNPVTAEVPETTPVVEAATEEEEKEEEEEEEGAVQTEEPASTTEEVPTEGAVQTEEVPVEGAPVEEVPTEVIAATPTEVQTTPAALDMSTPEETPGMPAIEGEQPVAVITAPEVAPEGENVSSDIMSALVKILGSDETGIVMEITPEGKVIIQKSGTEETSEYEHGQFEVIPQDDNVTEKVANVLAEIKKQKVLANQQPHFYNFLSEEQIADFKSLTTEARETIILALNESSYFNTQDVLNIIGKSLNEKALSYEERIVNGLPVSLKEAWNGLAQEQKHSVITESKYFSLVTNSDIASFWSTRPFAKAITSPEAILIKESAASTDNTLLNDDYVNAFIKTFDNLSIK